jgi:hypothetical protein
VQRVGTGKADEPCPGDVVRQVAGALDADVRRPGHDERRSLDSGEEVAHVGPPTEHPHIARAMDRVTPTLPLLSHQDRNSLSPTTLGAQTANVSKPASMASGAVLWSTAASMASTGIPAG